MTFPAVPLPSISSVWQGIFGRASVGRPWAAAKSAVVFFERGAEALAEAVDLIKRAQPGREIVVWMPDLICDEPLDWIRNSGSEISYYKTTSALEPSWEYLCGRLSSGPLHVLFIVHYFGFPNRALSKAREIARRGDIVVVEDAAHVIAPCDGVGEADFVVYSPRKLLSVPDIGCVIVKNGIADGPPTRYQGRGAWRWATRRLAQRLLRAMHVNWHRRWPLSDELPRSQRTVRGQRVAASDFARRMLAVEEESLPAIRDRRRRNYLRLAEYVRRSNFFELLFADLPDDVTPYVLPVLVPVEIERVVRAFRSSGTPASRWPDLPLEVIDGAESFREAIALSNTLVLLPIHQGLSDYDIDSIGAQVLSISASVPHGDDCAS